MARASMDLMSSPDPLIDLMPSSAATSYSRRMTRSQSSSQRQFTSLQVSSPRKQTFELDVGNGISPQKLLVTVEADGALEREKVSRRLFPTQSTPRSSRLRERTTTTRVPLRGLTDDEHEGLATPKRRGRPPKSATPGTTTSRKRAGTPLQRTPRRARKTASVASESASELGTEDAEATPRPTTKPIRKTPAARKSRSPVKKDAPATQEPATAKRRGRPRRQALAPADLEALAIQDTSSVGAALEPAADSTIGPQEDARVDNVYPDETMLSSINVSTDEETGHGDAEDDEEDQDIWMAALDNEPPASAENEGIPERDAVASPPRSTGPQPEIVMISDASSDVTSDGEHGYMGYGGGEDRSDAESLASESAAPSVAQDDPDRDTIAQGEDFSMIMMSSIHPLHSQGGIPESDLPEMGEATSFIVDQALESIRQSHVADDEQRSEDGQGHQSLRSSQRLGEPQPPQPLGSSRLASLEPEPEISSRNVSSSHPTRSGSATPTAARPSPGMLAPESARNNLWTRSPRRGKSTTPLGRQLAIKSLQKDESLMGTPVAARVNGSRLNGEEVSVYDDSFSEIPEAVLEAATPRPLRRHTDQHYGEEEEQEAEDQNEEVQQPQEEDSEADETQLDNAASALQHSPPKQTDLDRESTVTASAPPSDTASRLLTPDETPPNSDDTQLRPKEATADAIMSDHPVEPEMRSSPPMPVRVPMPAPEPLSQTAGLGRPSRHGVVARRSSETPLFAISSPPEPPVMEAVEHNRRVDTLGLPSTDAAARPPLSPIVRVGRVLQSVTSDPPSPKDRSSVLGSPFRSSVVREAPPEAQAAPVEEEEMADSPAPQAAAPSSAAKTNRSWTQALNPLSQIKNLVSQGAQIFSSPRFNHPATMSDPFAPDPDMPRPKAAPSSFRFSGISVSAMSQEPAEASMTSSTQAAPQTEDGMDWEPEGSPLGATEQRTRSVSVSSVVVARSSNSSPQQLSDSRSGVDESMVYPSEMEDGLAHENDREEEEEQEEEEEDDDIWAIEAQRTARSPMKTRQPQEETTADPPRRSMLPSPWTRSANSQRAYPPSRSVREDEEFSMLSLQARDDSLASSVGPRPEVIPVLGRRVDLTSFFSSPAVVPGQSVGLPSSSVQRSPSRNPAISSVRQKAFEPNLQRRDEDIFSSAPSSRLAQASRGVSASVSPEETPRPLFAHVPQKRDFTPLVGRNASSSLFGPGPSPSKPGSLGHPPQGTNNVIFRDGGDLSSSPTARDEEEEDDDDDEVEADESSFVAPVLKPLPSRAASPTKSCMRSPLKAKTPGRVVEFTSSTLSPLVQAQAALGQVAEIDEDEYATTGYAGHAGQARYVGAGAAAADSDEPDKENRDSPSRRSSSKSTTPVPTPPARLAPMQVQTRQSVLPPPAVASSSLAKQSLSRTQWTREHWVRMDVLLQERRKGSLNFQLQHRVPLAQKRRSAALLGKKVSAEGETMALEQWHLDVVDAFRTEVCDGAGESASCWDEHTLAKRLFALLVGEERRRAIKEGQAAAAPASTTPAGSVPMFARAQFGVYRA